ncbi:MULTISPECIES: hypothetical protein [Flavobacteriaceae]|uniref:Uncharacterized protein n=2 Tax=Flavobacteriaceae TaxID=49546 RepID=A0A4Y8AXR2_9FLAO|nr:MULTISPECIES: hypothetical protein [Flavobacteriaceae]TEW76792.1 hypothetical protein E2488_02790 [Gramella jeungdoensis]GGK49973.1 hypothetical protein GCM10007963_17930 [Lutibacter litoralis]
MKTIEILISIYLILHGLYSLYAVYKNKKTIHFELPSTTYISKWIFGENFDKWHNLFWGIIELTLGIILLNFFLELF